MDKSEVLENLCECDERNPGRSYCIDSNGVKSYIPKEEDCCCDNCMYGITELAEFTLELMEKLENN